LLLKIQRRSGFVVLDGRRGIVVGEMSNTPGKIMPRPLRILMQVQYAPALDSLLGFTLMPTKIKMTHA